MKTTLLALSTAPIILATSLSCLAEDAKSGNASATESAATANKQPIDINHIFDQLDRDHNGLLNQGELNGLTTILSGAGAAAGTTGADSAKGSGPAGIPAALGDLSDLFKSLDKDGDGMLSRQEFSAIDQKLNHTTASPAQK